MKYLAIFAAAAAISAAAGAFSANAIADHTMEKLETRYVEAVTDTCEANQVCSGMFFSTDYVVEEYELDDCGVIVYDDVDAGVEEAEIYVDHATALKVREAITKCEKLSGRLVLNEQESVGDIRVYTYTDKY